MRCCHRFSISDDILPSVSSFTGNLWSSLWNTHTQFKNWPIWIMIIEFITYLILYWIWFTILLIDPSPNFDPYFTQLPIIFSFWKQFRTFQYIFFVKWAKSKQHFQNKSWRSSKMVSGGQEYPYDFAKQMKNLLNSKFTQNTSEDQNKEQFTRDKNWFWVGFGIVTLFRTVRETEKGTIEFGGRNMFVFTRPENGSIIRRETEKI